ncbi:MAG: hypothetical protein WCJ19_05075 [bacterium]
MKFKIAFLVIYLAIIFAVIFTSQQIIFSPKNESGRVLSATDVQVSARVAGCNFTLIAKPEKRMPRTDNWSTILKVDIYNNSDQSFVGTFTTLTDNFGTSNVDICSLGFTPAPGNYDFLLRGYSHLEKAFLGLSTFNYASNTIDFSSGGQVLLAGETSNIYDNKINSLDISTQIRSMYSDDYKNDLNQDSKVNSLDISNTIYNFYMVGD